MYIDDPTAPGGIRFNDAVDAAHPGCKGPFCTPAANVQGSLGRNVLRGFPLSQLDLALRRDVPLGRARVELRMDTFNILNHPNFADPIGLLTNSLFGRSTSMLNRSIGGLNALYQIGGPRSMQFGARVRF
jgi:hypothetical protein